MPERFIARIGSSDGDDAARCAAFKAQVSALFDMNILLDREHLTVAATGGAPLPCGDHGLILGTLFRRGERQSVSALSQAEETAITAGCGQYLIDACWGSYVAFLGHPEAGIAVVRAPWGDLPCYHIERDGAIFLSSDVDLLMTCAAYRPALDWTTLVNQLVHGPFYHRATGLLGIEQLPGGERWSFTKAHELRESLWTPWTFAAPQSPISDMETAADLVRETALTCIGARASQFEHIMVTLSDGLDSSIVAASLKAQHTCFSAMTLVTRDAIGDERHYAALVSEAFECPLTAGLRDVNKVDIHRSGAQGRPFPCVHGFFMESMRLTHEAARDAGAQAIFNGAGGDTVFCSMQSGAPAADRLLAEGMGRGFARSLRDISQLVPASVPAVLRDAVGRAWLGRPALRNRPRFDLLTPSAQRLASAEPPHPWFTPPPAIPPGKAFHVWALAHFKSYVECLDPRSTLPIVAPLLSQPLVEACLTIPSWLWFDAGLNRVVARRAFSGLLPAQIVTRRSKGTPGTFTFEIFETHRDAIRDMLTGGELARQGLIDLPGILAILDTSHPVSHASVERILAFVDIEAWAAGWSASL